MNNWFGLLFDINLTINGSVYHQTLRHAILINCVRDVIHQLDMKNECWHYWKPCGWYFQWPKRGVSTFTCLESQVCYPNNSDYKQRWPMPDIVVQVSYILWANDVFAIFGARWVPSSNTPIVHHFLSSTVSCHRTHLSHEKIPLSNPMKY